MHARLILATGTASLALAGSVFAASPAQAVACGATGDVCTGTTTVAFTVAAGTIAIATTSAAAAASQSLVGATSQVTASLGLTTVTDTRVAGAGWVVSASSTVFTPTTTGSTIPAADATYFVPAAPTAVLGAHTLSVGSSTAAGAVAAGAALVTDVGTGANTATFLPSIKIALPVGTAALAYTGTVTQSVV